MIGGWSTGTLPQVAEVLVVLDVLMPAVRHGPHAAQVLREERSALPVPHQQQDPVLLDDLDEQPRTSVRADFDSREILGLEPPSPRATTAARPSNSSAEPLTSTMPSLNSSTLITYRRAGVDAEFVVQCGP